MTRWFEGFSRGEWRVLNFSLMCMMLCAFLLSNPRVLLRVGDLLEPDRRMPFATLGEIKGDVRVKRENAREWSSPRANISVGEVLITGDAGRVRMKVANDIEVHVAPKSLLRVILLEGRPTIDLVSGAFDWLITGEQPVAVRGASGVLMGRQATVHVQIEEGAEPEVRVTSGEGVLQYHGQVGSPDDTSPPVSSAMANEVYFYIWHLEDFYRIEDQRLLRREKPPMEVALEIPLNWDHPVSAGPFTVQTSGSYDFTENRRFYTAASLGITIDHASLGENFWRVGYNNLNWSQVRSFRVDARFAEVAVKPIARELSIRLQSTNQVLAKWECAEAMAGFVAEVSTDENFAEEKTNTRWLSAPEIVVEAESKSIQFVRLRAFNSRQEISDWSKPVRVRAF